MITINAPADQCESLGQQFGCSHVDTTGGRCGLFGCASCGALNPNQGM